MACLAIVLVLTLAGVYVFRTCVRVPVQLVDHLGSQLATVAAAFHQGTITTTFTSYATTISASQNFQFATLSQHERFKRTDEATTGFGYIPLPDVVVEADAPVTYTYYLDLNDRWDFVLKDGEIQVTAPRIRFNRPAVDASRINYEVKKGSLLRNTAVATESLKSTITWLTLKRAETNINLVRETGRKKTEEFLRTWVTRSFTDGKNYPVRVRFRDELEISTPKDPTAKGD